MFFLFNQISYRKIAFFFFLSNFFSSIFPSPALAKVISHFLKIWVFPNARNMALLQVSGYFLLALGIFGIDTPKEPIPPLIESNEKKEFDKKDKKKDKKLKSASVTVKLCDGRQVIGNIEYEKEEILFQHSKEGIRYEKKLLVSDIKQIKILSWELKKGKKFKDGTSYQAYPHKILISNNSGEIFSIKGLQDTEFLNLNLSNQNGNAKLFTYWFDLLYENGSWYSKLPAFSGTEREDCHSDVIRLILFN